MVTVIANGAADRRNPAIKGRSRDDAAVPNRRNQIIGGDDALTIANKILQQIKDLRFDSNKIEPAPQFSPVDIKGIVFEGINQL